MTLTKFTAKTIGVLLTVLLFTVVPLGCSDCDVEIVTIALPDGRVRIPYSFQVDADCGGDFWFLAEGNLPPGIGLLDDGILLGTPLVAGTSTFTLGVVDGYNGDAAFKGFALTIVPPLEGQPSEQSL